MALTLVHGVDEAAVIHAFGGDPARTRPDTAGCLSQERWAEAYADFADVDVDFSELAAQDRAHLWLTRVGEWLLVSEDNGFRGTEPDVIAALGAPVHVCVMWNVAVSANFVYAEGGQIQAGFRDFLDAAYGPRPELLRSWADGLNLNVDDELEGDPEEDAHRAYVSVHQRALVMMERATGVTVWRAELERRQLHFTVREGWRADLAGRSAYSAPDEPVAKDVVRYEAVIEPLRPSAQAEADAGVGSASEQRREPVEDERLERQRETLRRAHADPEALQYVPPAWTAAPRDALPAVMPVEKFLGRSEQAFVWLRALAVYPTGVMLEIDARAHHRTLGAPMVDSSGQVSDRKLRLAVQFADGQRATNLAAYYGDSAPSRPVLQSTGTILGTQEHHWLWPLPPAGPLVLTCRWPAYGIDRSELRLDATAIRAAADRCRQAWIT